MGCFRFRSGAIIGRWRTTERQAIEDAIRCGQARRTRSEVTWLVDGRIEPAEEVSAPIVARQRRAGQSRA